jgi:hypothetical protein
LDVPRTCLDIACIKILPNINVSHRLSLGVGSFAAGHRFVYLIILLAQYFIQKDVVPLLGLVLPRPPVLAPVLVQTALVQKHLPALGFLAAVLFPVLLVGLEVFPQVEISAEAPLAVIAPELVVQQFVLLQH